MEPVYAKQKNFAELKIVRIVTIKCTWQIYLAIWLLHIGLGPVTMTQVARRVDPVPNQLLDLLGFRETSCLFA